MLHACRARGPTELRGTSGIGITVVAVAVGMTESVSNVVASSASCRFLYGKLPQEDVHERRSTVNVTRKLKGHGSYVRILVGP